MKRGRFLKLLCGVPFVGVLPKMNGVDLPVSSGDYIPLPDQDDLSEGDWQYTWTGYEIHERDGVRYMEPYQGG